MKCEQCTEDRLCSRHEHLEDGPARPSAAEVRDFYGDDHHVGWNLPPDYPSGW